MFKDRGFNFQNLQDLSLAGASDGYVEKITDGADSNPVTISLVSVYLSPTVSISVTAAASCFHKPKHRKKHHG